MNRTQLFDSLSNLPPAAFDRLLVAVNMPRMNRAGAAAKIGDQVSALLEWADSNIGPGLEAIAHHLAELNHFEFDTYLRSLMDTYEEWWEHYTLTDATGKVEQPKPEQTSVFDFDFGLMVQTITKEKDAPGPEPRSEEREKTERLPVLDGIRKYADDHVLLVGRPGSGKSTALIKLVLDVADQTLKDGQGQIPILIELRYWQTSVIERIQAFLNRHDPSLSLDDADLNALLRQGRFLLLIDGLNELPSDEARTQLATFRRDHPKVPMIFTTRDLGLGNSLGIEKKLEMQPLTEPQMKAFIRAYVPNQAEAMLRQLSDRLREFGQTPLLLWMLCEVFQRSPNRQMPTNLAEVFRAFTTMYEDSSVRKHEVALLKGDVRPLSDRRLWKEALKALAALMMQGETPVDFRVAIHRTEAERELAKLFSKEKFPVRDILDDLLKYHLLQNRTTDQLEFRHQLIQEYYAAEHLLDLLPELSDGQLKRNYLNLLKWTEPFALMLALIEDEAQVLRVVELAMKVDLILAAHLAGKILPDLQNSPIKSISELQISDWLKIEMLGESGSELATLKLLEVIEDSEISMRCRAIKALGKISSNTANLALQKRATEDLEPSVRWRAVEALGEIGSPEAIPALLKAIEDSNGHVRNKAAIVLGSFGTDEVIMELLEKLENPNKHVRRGATRALSEICSDKVVTALIKASKDSDNCVHRNAIRTLGKIGSKESILALIKIIANSDESISMFAAEMLEQTNPKLVVQELLQAINPAEKEAYQKAVAKLDKTCSQQADLNFISMTKHLDKARVIKKSDRHMYKRLITATGKIGSKKVVPFLLKAAKNPRKSVRIEALKALGRIDREAAVSVLLEGIKDSNQTVRRNAAVLLGDIGSEVATQSLIAATSDCDLKVRLNAVKALGRFSPRIAVPVFLRILRESSDKSMRRAAAKAFRNFREEDVANILPSLLKALSTDFGKEAIYAIQGIQSNCKFYNYEIFHGIIPQGETISLYCSYALADEALLIQLANHLTLLEHQSIITSWSSHQILPGSDRTQTIQQQLNTADIILLLISPDAIADDTCYHLEIQRAMERQQSGETRVIPILLRPVDWQGAPFSQLDVLPKNHQPVTTWQNQDQAFREIAEGIRTVAMELRKDKGNDQNSPS